MFVNRENVYLNSILRLAKYPIMIRYTIFSYEMAIPFPGLYMFRDKTIKNQSNSIDRPTPCE